MVVVQAQAVVVVQTEAVVVVQASMVVVQAALDISQAAVVVVQTALVVSQAEVVVQAEVQLPPQVRLQAPASQETIQLQKAQRRRWLVRTPWQDLLAILHVLLRRFDTSDRQQLPHVVGRRDVHTHVLRASPWPLLVEDRLGYRSQDKAREGLEPW